MNKRLTLVGVRRPRSIKDFGPGALLLEWEQRIDPLIHLGVLSYAAAVQRLPFVAECIPAYASLLVRCTGDPGTMRELIYDLTVPPMSASEGILHRLPVCYGGAHGADLAAVARATGMTEEGVVDLHVGQTYRVYLFGYRPGFAFLGTVDERIALARHASPRPSVPAGSVGLAGRQTGVYPVAAPGGWQLIGHCPLPLINSEGHTRFSVGDRVQFYTIRETEIDAIKQADGWTVN